MAQDAQPERVGRIPLAACADSCLKTQQITGSSAIFTSNFDSVIFQEGTLSLFGCSRHKKSSVKEKSSPKACKKSKGQTYEKDPPLIRSYPESRVEAALRSPPKPRKEKGGLRLFGSNSKQRARSADRIVSRRSPPRPLCDPSIPTAAPSSPGKKSVFHRLLGSPKTSNKHKSAELPAPRSFLETHPTKSSQEPKAHHSFRLPKPKTPENLIKRQRSNSLKVCVPKFEDVYAHSPGSPRKLIPRSPCRVDPQDPAICSRQSPPAMPQGGAISTVVNTDVFRIDKKVLGSSQEDVSKQAKSDEIDPVQKWVNNIRSQKSVDEGTGGEGASKVKLTKSPTEVSDKHNTTHDDFTLGAEAKLMNGDGVQCHRNGDQPVKQGTPGPLAQQKEWHARFAQQQYDSLNSDSTKHTYSRYMTAMEEFIWQVIVEYFPGVEMSKSRKERFNRVKNLQTKKLKYQERIDQILKEREGDPEQILTNLGFADPERSKGIAQRLPPRFLTYGSQAVGITTDSVMQKYPELKDVLNHASPFTVESPAQSVSDEYNVGLSTFASIASQVTLIHRFMQRSRPGGHSEALEHQVQEGLSPDGNKYTSILHPDNTKHMVQTGMYNKISEPKTSLKAVIKKTGSLAEVVAAMRKKEESLKYLGLDDPEEADMSIQATISPLPYAVNLEAPQLITKSSPWVMLQGNSPEPLVIAPAIDKGGIDLTQNGKSSQKSGLSPYGFSRSYSVPSNPSSPDHGRLSRKGSLMRQLSMDIQDHNLMLTDSLNTNIPHVSIQHCDTADSDTTVKQPELLSPGGSNSNQGGSQDSKSQLLSDSRLRSHQILQQSKDELQSFELEEIQSADMVKNDLPTFTQADKQRHLVRTGSAQSDSSGFAEADHIDIEDADWQALKVAHLGSSEDSEYSIQYLPQGYSNRTSPLGQNTARKGTVVPTELTKEECNIDVTIKEKQGQVTGSCDNLNVMYEPKESLSSTEATLQNAVRMGSVDSVESNYTLVAFGQLSDSEKEEITSQLVSLSEDREPVIVFSASLTKAAEQPQGGEGLSGVQCGPTAGHITSESADKIEPTSQTVLNTSELQHSPVSNSSEEVDSNKDENENTISGSICIADGKTSKLNAGFHGEREVKLDASYGKMDSVDNICAAGNALHQDDTPLWKFGPDLRPHKILCSLLKQQIHISPHLHQLGLGPASESASWSPTQHHIQQHLLEEVKLMQHAVQKYKLELKHLQSVAEFGYQGAKSELVDEEMSMYEELSRLREDILKEVSELERSLVLRTKSIIAGDYTDEGLCPIDLASLQVIQQMIEMLKEQVYHGSVVHSMTLPVMSDPSETMETTAPALLSSPITPLPQTLQAQMALIQRQMEAQQMAAAVSLNKSLAELRMSLVEEVRRGIQEETKLLRQQVVDTEKRIQSIRQRNLGEKISDGDSESNDCSNNNETAIW